MDDFKPKPRPAAIRSGIGASTSSDHMPIDVNSLKLSHPFSLQKNRVATRVGAQR
jgi:hypothetical protein